MRKKKVIIIDDENHYRQGLSDYLKKEADVITFENPDAFAEMFTETDDLKGIHLIIIDYCFDNYSALDKDLVSYIRDDLKYRGLIVSWSLEDDLPKKFCEKLNAKLPKKLMKLYEIERCLN